MRGWKLNLGLISLNSFSFSISSILSPFLDYILYTFLLQHLCVLPSKVCV